MSGSDIIATWPEESREAAQLVVDKYGEPDEVSESLLTWYEVGPWKRVEASRVFHAHNFPAPHTDSVASVIDYQVPANLFSAVAEFDGSVITERTAGEASARCHDVEANSLALNLMHDIVTEQKTVTEAREYYAMEFLDARRQNPTPYMQQLHFIPHNGAAGDPDERILSDAQLDQAASGRQENGENLPEAAEKSTETEHAKNTAAVTDPEERSER